MSTQRVEAFSDGVIAIIITIMVLELKTPESPTFGALLPLAPIFLSYALSFLVVAIMWVNHHHLLHIAKHPSAKLLWTNNFLLFFMSLIPFVTAYLGDHPLSPFAVASYGFVLTLSAMAFTILRYEINRHHRDNHGLTRHNRKMFTKSAASTLLYASSIPLAYLSVWCAYFIFVLIPVIYFLPERKIVSTNQQNDQ